jgi:hypothetical protein
MVEGPNRKIFAGRRKYKAKRWTTKRIRLANGKAGKMTVTVCITGS